MIVQQNNLTQTNRLQLLGDSLDSHAEVLNGLDHNVLDLGERDTAYRLVTEGKRLIKLVTEERMKLTRVLDADKKRIMDTEKDLCKSLFDAVARIEQAVKSYDVRIVAERQAQMAALEQDIPALDSWLQAAPMPTVTNKPSGVQMRWTFEIENVADVPLGYMKVCETALREAISGGVRTIPGIRIFQQPSTTFR